MKSQCPLALVILDGFGYREEDKNNAIACAHTPTLSFMLNTYPHALVKASGAAVGLPDEFAGNSEVGHLTIGLGAVQLQPFTIIENAIADGSFFTNEILNQSLEKLARSQKKLHIIGLLSDAAVHSHNHHLFAFLKAASSHALSNIIAHPILDGRDTPPQSAEYFLEQLTHILSTVPNSSIGSIVGRFYGMDRNQNWDLTAQYFKMLTTKIPQSHFENYTSALDHYYKEHITDEFIPPTLLTTNHTIEPGDGVIFFNFRPDRARQLTALFLGKAPNMTKSFPLSFFMTPFSYGTQYETTTLFKKAPTNATFSDWLHDCGYRVFFIAETEKTAHVTYFFNGGRETRYDNERWVTIPSEFPKFFEAHPRMRADAITQAVVESLEHDPYDIYIINYANADMVGHTGNMKATIKAIECLDEQLKKLHEEIVIKRKGTLVITSDHGKAEEMFDIKAHQHKTAHTTNPVLCIIAQKELADSEKVPYIRELSDITPLIQRILLQK